MEINRAAEAILAELDSCNGHIMHSVVEGGANLYDGNPAAGSPRGSQRVEMETFVYLRDNNLITRVDQPDQLRGPGQRQYRINEAGKAALSAARNCSR